MSWKARHSVTAEYAVPLKSRYIADLNLLYDSLLHRFQAVI